MHFAFHYSNLAFALLGQIVERLEARSWGDVVTQRILAPLEMKDTGLAPDEAGRALGYQVHPHTGVATLEPRFDLRATAPLGGLWSTVADLGRYASFVADPFDEVLAPDSLDEMCRPLIMTDVQGWARAYGLGYDLQRIGERVLAGYGGAMPGFLAGRRSGARTGSGCGLRQHDRRCRAGDPGWSARYCGARRRAPPWLGSGPLPRRSRT